MSDYANGWNRGFRFAIGGSDEVRKFTDEQLAAADGPAVELERAARCIEVACHHERVEHKWGLVSCRRCPAIHEDTTSNRKVHVT